MPYFPDEELCAFSLKNRSKNVKISTRASNYRSDKVLTESHFRTDDYRVISASDNRFFIDSHVYIEPYSSPIEKEKIELSNCSGSSARVSI